MVHASETPLVAVVQTLGEARWVKRLICSFEDLTSVLEWFCRENPWTAMVCTCGDMLCIIMRRCVQI